MPILTCEEAQRVLNEDVKTEPSQAAIDFVNDFGGRIGGGKVWTKADQPPEGVVLRVLKPVRLHFLERVNGEVVLRAETCDRYRAHQLAVINAGLGNMNIAAQLWAIHQSDSTSVKREGE